MWQRRNRHWIYSSVSTRLNGQFSRPQYGIEAALLLRFCKKKMRISKIQKPPRYSQAASNPLCYIRGWLWDGAVRRKFWMFNSHPGRTGMQLTAYRCYRRDGSRRAWRRAQEHHEVAHRQWLRYTRSKLWKASPIRIHRAFTGTIVGVLFITSASQRAHACHEYGRTRFLRVGETTSKRMNLVPGENYDNPIVISDDKPPHDAFPLAIGRTSSPAVRCPVQPTVQCLKRGNPQKTKKYDLRKRLRIVWFWTISSWRSLDVNRLSHHWFNLGPAIIHRYELWEWCQWDRYTHFFLATICAYSQTGTFGLSLRIIFQIKWIHTGVPKSVFICVTRVQKPRNVRLG